MNHTEESWMYARLAQCLFGGAKREGNVPFTSASKDKYCLGSILSILITYLHLLVVNYLEPLSLFLFCISWVISPRCLLLIL